MTKLKKVILFIVEGCSDESALATIMSEYFNSNEIKFHVYRGDITTDKNSNVSNIITKINEVLKVEMKKYHYKLCDMLKIIHITDTDGVFISKERIVYQPILKENQDSIIEYTLDNIKTNNVDSIFNRNKKKSLIISKLIQTKSVNKIPYSIYYFSRNIEHVLFNIIKDISDDEKNEYADNFSIQYENNVDDFISFINDSNFAAPGTYNETWQLIKKDTESLKRHSNIHLIFNKSE